MPDRNGLPVACNRDCGATCAMVARRRSNGQYQLLTNPLNHPLKKPCPRGLRCIESRNASDRLTRPLIRSGPRGSGRFKEAGWDNALDLVAERIQSVVDSRGAESILNMGGSGACKGALHHTGRLVSRFLSNLGPVTWLSGSYSMQAASFVLPFAFGSSHPGYDARTLLDTRFIILWGANVADTRFGNETEQVIRHVRDHGGEVIVVDPRRSRSARDLATEWIPILPGTDTAAMLAIAWVLYTDDLLDDAFVSSHVHGAEEVRGYVQGDTDGVPKTPQWAASQCGVPAKTLHSLARRYAAARPAALVPGFSIQRTVGGEESFRMAIALQALTGNTGRPGGTSGTNMWVAPPGPAVAVCSSPPPEGRSVPKATWPDSILNDHRDGMPAISAAYVCGTNYLNQGSDISRNIAAFEALDFVVCHELFLTSTARYADVVLPVTHYLEREDVITAEDNYLYYSAQVFEPLGEARDDFDIFADLSSRLGIETFSDGKTKSEWIRWIIANSAVTAAGETGFRQSGIFDGGDHNRLGLSAFIDDPVAHPLDTPSGKIEISSAGYGQTGYPEWPTFRTASNDERLPLRLITPHSRFRVNSTGSNIPWIQEQDPVELWMNPVDAGSRGIASGDLVTVQNETGKMRVPVAVTGDVMEGVVCCPQGAWYGNAADGAVNRLTSLEPTRPSIGTRTHSVFVDVVPMK